MYRLALKMLLRDRAKYLGILIGLTFASLLITQQSSIFFGLMSRTYGFIQDTGQADIWVMDPKIQYVDDVINMQDMELFRVRGVPGVKWAVPLYKGMLQARLPDGSFQNSFVIGVDDATLIGAPPEMLKGKLIDLRQSDGVIVDLYGAEGKLASTRDGKKIPLHVGSRLEINDHRAKVVGIGLTTRTLNSLPIIYTTFSRAVQFAPPQRKMLSYVLVKAKEGVDVETLCQTIRKRTGLQAYTGKQFEYVTMMYIFKYTGIPINFGFAVLLGLLVGIAIAGQTFYNFVQDNLRYFGTFMAMGVQNRKIVLMILLQTLMMGVIGYGLGVGLAALFGLLLKNTQLSFLLTWHLLLITFLAVMFICIGSTFICVKKILKLEPAIVFRS
ncbi:MAG: hypothetical protein K940chlam8_00526 [Chlamydiae bacterium]|nr:hypothetical protein [Chlamydiota bacterium]